MTYSLRRIDPPDLAGDSGPLFSMFSLGPDGNIIKHENPVAPEVGWAVQVGTFQARMFGNQDYWTTTPVTEILYENYDKDKDETIVIFKTGNSMYLWKDF